jgi:hypothetical protein
VIRRDGYKTQQSGLDFAQACQLRVVVAVAVNGKSLGLIDPVANQAFQKV